MLLTCWARAASSKIVQPNELSFKITIVINQKGWQILVWIIWNGLCAPRWNFVITTEA